MPRLPREVVPNRYRLTIVPNLEAFTFQGFVEISVRVTSPVSTISLHALELSFPWPQDVTVTSKEAKEAWHCKAVTIDAEDQRATFAFSKQIPPGSYRLCIPYHGVLNDKLAGFYRSTYTAGDGKKKYMGVTQFEACDARRALPCWDEPAIKAVFEVTLIVPPHLTAVSNMPATKRARTEAMEPVTPRHLKYDSGWCEISFAPSPIMSTYLLAWVVGEFDFVSGYTKEHVEVRVYTPPGRSHQGRFALDVAIKAIEFYNQLYGTPYPLPKADLLAIPDFAAGAMENWGCITYRDTRLLIDPQHSSINARMAVSRTICHELAHMWFGNLVTMEWWTQLWLNEGFARFMEFKAVDHIFPEWRVWDQFLVSVYQAALNLDALESSHPIEVEVKHPDEISAIFDTISYAKGASVIRMLHDTIGEDKFVAGVRSYLSKLAYKNAVTADLWAALKDAANGRDIARMMNGFLYQTGYPVVTVEKCEAVGDKKRRITVRQERFLLSGKPSSDSKEPSPLWTINLCVREAGSSGSGSSAACQWVEFSGERHTFEVEVTGKDPILLLNAGQSGFFRVHYLPETYTALSAALKSNPEALPHVDRLGVVIDIFALAKANRLPVSSALTVLRAFDKEACLHVVEVIASELSGLLSVHGEQPYAPKLKKLIAGVFASHLDKYGLAPPADGKEHHTSPLFRATAISMMGGAGDARVIKEAISRVAAFAADEKANPIPADLRGPFFNLAVKEGGKEAFEQVLRIYRRTDLAEEKQRCMTALGRTRDPTLIQRAIEWTMGPEVRKGDGMYVFSSIATSAVGRELAWAYLRDNHDALMTAYRGTGFLLGYLYGGVLGTFVDFDKANEVEAFFATRPNKALDRNVKQAVESIRSKAQRLANQKADLATWLDAQADL